MSGSGLEDILELNYGPNTVKHIISGKAYDRAVRGHLLLHRAAMSLLVEHILPDSTSIVIPDKLTTEDVENLKEACQEIMIVEGSGSSQVQHNPFHDSNIN